MKGTAALAVLLCLVSRFSVGAVTDDQVIGALDELLQHHPAEVIGFAWHDIPVEKVDHAIASLYHEFSLQPIWVSGAGPGAKAQVVRDTIAAATDEGLNPADYEAAVIKEKWNSRTAPHGGKRGARFCAIPCGAG